MSEVDERTRVIRQLRVAQVDLRDVWVGVGGVRARARFAARALGEASEYAARFRTESDNARGEGLLNSVGEQMGVVQRLCADGASCAERARASLTAADRNLVAAWLWLDDCQLTPEISEIKAKVEGLMEMIDLAAPLTRSLHGHLRDAGLVAGTLTSPAALDGSRQSVARRVDGGIRWVGRDVVRAGEATGRLDHAAGGAARSVEGSEWYAGLAHSQERLRSVQRCESSSSAARRGPAPAR